MTISRWFLLIAIILSLPTLSGATTYYVSKVPGASNSNACTSPDANACSTITGGAGKMSGGDTLFIQAGTYNERMDEGFGFPWRSGSSGLYTRYARYQNDQVILRPSGNGSVVYMTSSSFIEFDGLVFDVSNVSSSDATFVLQTGTDSIRVQNCELIGTSTHRDTSILIPFGNDHEFLRNNIHNNRNYCIYQHSNNSIFDGNIIHDCGGYGVHQYDTDGNAQGNIYRNNRLYNLGFDGWCAGGGGDPGHACTAQALIMYSGSNNQAYNNVIYNVYGGMVPNGPNARVYNNTIYDTTEFCIHDNFGSSSGSIIRNNICYQAGDIIGGSGVTCSHNLGPGCGSISTSDPGFKSLAGGSEDFHVLAGSPAIGAGPRQGSVLTDAEGRNRSDPTTLGAYEFVADNPPPEPPPPGLQVWLRGNGTSDDFSGNTRHGVLQGGALANGACITCPDTSFVFDGINDYISIVENIAFRPTDHFCISVWMNSTNLNYAYFWDIAGYGLWHDPSGNLHGYISPSSGFVDVVTPSSNILTGVNNHLVYTKRPLGLYLYLNGNQTAFTPTTSTLTYIGTPSVFIGRNSAGSQEFFNGRKAAIRFYNAECTPAAVLNLFNEGVPLANTATTHMQAAKTNFAQSEANLVGALDADIWHLRTEPLDLIFTITRTGATTNVHYPLECALNGGSFLPVTNALGAHGVQITNNSALNMGDVTTVPLPANLPTSGMTPVAGRVVADTIDSGFTAPLADGQYTQWRYSVAFGAPADVLDTIQCQPDGVDTPMNIKTITLLAPPSERRLEGGRFEGVSLR